MSCIHSTSTTQQRTPNPRSVGSALEFTLPSSAFDAGKPEAPTLGQQKSGGHIRRIELKSAWDHLRRTRRLNRALHRLQHYPQCKHPGLPRPQGPWSSQVAPFPEGCHPKPALRLVYKRGSKVEQSLVNHGLRHPRQCQLYLI